MSNVNKAKTVSVKRQLDRGAPLVVSYGVGVDSTAMLVGMHQRHIRPDLILFANTGCEHPETYDYVDYADRFLKRWGFPEITVAQYVPKRSHTGIIFESLEQESFHSHRLPSPAYGFKKCTLKWKRSAMDNLVKRDFAPAEEAWAKRLKVVRAIGYDAGAADMKRGWEIKDDKLWAYWYPLREWDWTREDCIDQIRRAGLKVPRKSSCFICPNMQRWEVDKLMDEHPDLAQRAMMIEALALPSSTSVLGLWRHGTKGTRDPDRWRPGSWTQYLLRRKLAQGKRLTRDESWLLDWYERTLRQKYGTIGPVEPPQGVKW